MILFLLVTGPLLVAGTILMLMKEGVSAAVRRLIEQRRKATEIRGEQPGPIVQLVRQRDEAREVRQLNMYDDVDWQLSDGVWKRRNGVWQRPE